MCDFYKASSYLGKKKDVSREIESQMEPNHDRQNIVPCKHTCSLFVIRDKSGWKSQDNVFVAVCLVRGQNGK